jgi:phospholipase C
MWNKAESTWPLCAALAILTGCAGAGAGNSPATAGNGLRTLAVQSAALRQPIKNVIVIVQENRSVDNLFQTLPGANTQNFGFDSHGDVIPLARRPLGSPIDCDHSHSGFVTETDNGKNDHFDLQTCADAAGISHPAYSYVDPATIPQYMQLASTYAFADEVLQSNEGPSFPAHLYLIAATSNDRGTKWNISENDGSPAGCNAPQQEHVTTIDMTSAYPGVQDNPIFPCIDPNTTFNELDAADISWKYYTPSVNSIWTAPYAIRSLYESDRAKVVVPETNVLSDILAAKLPQVSYVIPSAKNSDHPGPNDNDGGPTWVASIYNAVCSSRYWNHAAIVVVWDDWGGWFDHVSFRHPANSPSDPYEYGLRVPLLAISPYAKGPHYVGHEQRDFSSIARFIEGVYGLSTLDNLNMLDSQTDDLFGLFNFGGARSCTPISTPGVTLQDLINRPADTDPVDTE